MKFKITSLLVCTISLTAFGQTLFVPGGPTSGGIAPSSNGNVGIGTVGPQTTLHLNSIGSTFLRLDKASSSYEGGLQFNVGSTVKYYFWSDNDDNDALKLMAAGISGENDGAPRMMFPSDNKNIYMGLSGGNVGIGTNAPAAKLHITGLGGQWTTVAWNKAIEIPNAGVIKWSHNSDKKRFGIGQTDNGLSFIRGTTDDNTSVASYDLFISNDGKVGVGNNIPAAKLHIMGLGGNWSNAAWNRAIEIPNAGVMKWSSNSTGYRFGIGQTEQGLYFIKHNTDDGTGTPTYPMLILNNGNVGIGTPDPGSFKLAVNGKIWTQEVNVAMTNPGPDYVFEKDYDLLSLTELESYIKANKHLPEVPSAKEMEEDGLNLKEMNLLLLKKVEELTLHIIQLEKRDKSLEAEIEKLKK